MKLEWERPGVVRMTAKVEEVAALLAGARLAAGALESQAAESTSGLRRVLADFDRAAGALSPPSPKRQGGAAPIASASPGSPAPPRSPSPGAALPTASGPRSTTPTSS